MQLFSNKISLLITLIIAAGIFSYTSVHAAEIFFGSTGREIGVGQMVEIGVFLNTHNDSINAIEGEVDFPIDMLDFSQFHDGNSIISLWVDKPRMDTQGKIMFSGIVPGGYQGDKGMLFSFVAQVKKKGEIKVVSSHETVLRSDGVGTAVSVSRAPLSIIGSTASSTSTYYPPYDPDQPETFVPTIGHDPNLFDGKYFVAFTTQDKGSGISHYEIAEEHRYPWQKLFPHSSNFVVVKSPYELHDQKLQSTIYIKAIDNNGNERIVEIAPTYIVWYEKYFIWCILGLGIILALTILIRLYGGKKKTQ